MSTDKVRLNMAVPAELNDQRKALQVTWSQVLHAGLQSLQSDTAPTKIDPSIGENIKLAVKYLTDAWSTIKKANG